MWTYLICWFHLDFIILNEICLTISSFQALGNAEDDTDVQAAKVAKAEQKAELAEFDEDIPWDEKEEQQKQEQGSKLEQELAMLEKEVEN